MVTKRLAPGEGKKRIKVGMRVMLRNGVARTPPGLIPEEREDHKSALVLSIGEEGQCHLSRDLNGMRWWNADDLQRAPGSRV